MFWAQYNSPPRHYLLPSTHSDPVFQESVSIHHTPTRNKHLLWLHLNSQWLVFYDLFILSLYTHKHTTPPNLSSPTLSASMDLYTMTTAQSPRLSTASLSLSPFNKPILVANFFWTLCKPYQLGHYLRLLF